MCGLCVGGGMVILFSGPAVFTQTQKINGDYNWPFMIIGDYDYFDYYKLILNYSEPSFSM